MGTLLLVALLASLSTSSNSPAPLTPEQEVEAWDPAVDGRDPADGPVRPANDNTAQAFAAASPLIGGMLGGVAGGVIVFFATGIVLAPLGGGAVVIVVAASVLTLIGVPCLALAFLGPDDLPGWTVPAVAGSVFVGAAVGGAAGLLGAIAAVRATATPGDDCAFCGASTFAGVGVATLVGVFVGGAAAGTTTTTFAAFAE